jgi:hypothetical protein
MQEGSKERKAIGLSTFRSFSVRRPSERRLARAEHSHRMVRSSRQRFALVYTALALLRILIAFTSTSIIHPDEHFQNPEIAADAVFEYDTRLGGDGPLRTWEWRGPTPARSIVPVFGSTGLAFCIVRMLCGDRETQMLAASSATSLPC